MSDSRTAQVGLGRRMMIGSIACTPIVKTRLPSANYCGSFYPVFSGPLLLFLQRIDAFNIHIGRRNVPGAFLSG